MGIQIEDGRGRGNHARVNSSGELAVIADARSLEHQHSFVNGDVYQVFGTVTIANATTEVLHIKNTSASQNIFISFIQLQVVDPANGTTLPSAATYWSLAFDRTVSSGGSVVTPININRSSANTASAVVTHNGATMAGTAAEVDRYYPKADGDNKGYDMRGGWVLGLNDTIEARIISDHTAGTAYCRMTFGFLTPDT